MKDDAYFHEKGNYFIDSEMPGIDFSTTLPIRHHSLLQLRHFRDIGFTETTRPTLTIDIVIADALFIL